MHSVSVLGWDRYILSYWEIIHVFVLSCSSRLNAGCQQTCRRHPDVRPAPSWRPPAACSTYWGPVRPTRGRERGATVTGLQPAHACTCTHGAHLPALPRAGGAAVWGVCPGGGRRAFPWHWLSWIRLFFLAAGGRQERLLCDNFVINSLLKCLSLWSQYR